MILESVRRWCSWSSSSKEVSREILGSPQCTCWVQVVRDHPHIVDFFTSLFLSTKLVSSLTDSPRVAAIDVSFRTFHSKLRSRYCPSPFSMDCAVAMHLTCSLCIALCHALLIASTPFFARNAPYNDLHVFRSPSRNACSALSIAVGGALPYLRSDSV